MCRLPSTTGTQTPEADEGDFVKPGLGFRVSDLVGFWLAFELWGLGLTVLEPSSLTPPRPPDPEAIRPKEETSTCPVLGFPHQ